MVQEVRDFGLPGVDLEAGDHFCAIYVGAEERDAIVIPYLRAGLLAGDKVVCVIDSGPLGELIASMGDESVVGRYIESRQLELHTADEAYLGTTPFSTATVLEFWASTVAAAVADGSYGFARGTGEMPLKMNTPSGRAEFFRYEAVITQFARSSTQAYLCMYDLERFGGGIVVDLLRTHPKLLMGGLVLENPHYRPPDDLAALPT
jgi:hypothetical protein